MTLVPKPGVLDIVPYVGGRASGTGAARIFKLSSNESPFGASPAALEAYQAAANEIGIYPDGSAKLLRETLAAHHGLDPERIICGNGSGPLLSLLATCYLRAKDEALMSVHGFILYKIATLANSATPVEVPEVEAKGPVLKLAIDDILERVSGRTRLVYIANPNNPTGGYLSAAELKRLHEGLPASVLLVIDAAYAEYATNNDYDPGMELASSADNVVMTRTFSKIYGLAGLRVGWAYGPAHVIDTMNRVRGPFDVSIAAQRAAVAAQRDVAFVDRAARHNAKWRSWLIGEIRRLGLRTDESAANFVLIHFPNAAGKRAQDADRFLMSRGLILRGLANYALPNAMRMTVGSEEENRLVVQALREFVAMS